MVTYGDEPVRAQQRLLVVPLPCYGLIPGPAACDTRQFVDKRYYRPPGQPEIQVLGHCDAGEGVDYYRVKGGRVECGSESWVGCSLLLGRCPTGHDLLDFESPLTQAGDHTPVVQVAAGLAARVPHRDESDAQEDPLRPARLRGLRRRRGTPRCAPRANRAPGRGGVVPAYPNSRRPPLLPSY